MESVMKVSSRQFLLFYVVTEFFAYLRTSLYNVFPWLLFNCWPRMCVWTVDGQNGFASSAAECSAVESLVVISCLWKLSAVTLFRWFFITELPLLLWIGKLFNIWCHFDSFLKFLFKEGNAESSSARDVSEDKSSASERTELKTNHGRSENYPLARTPSKYRKRHTLLEQVCSFLVSSQLLLNYGLGTCVCVLSELNMGF